MKLFMALLISSNIMWLQVTWQNIKYGQVSCSCRRSLTMVKYPACGGEPKYNIFDSASNTKQQYVASTSLR